MPGMSLWPTTDLGVYDITYFETATLSEKFTILIAGDSRLGPIATSLMSTRHLQFQPHRMSLRYRYAPPAALTTLQGCEYLFPSLHQYEYRGIPATVAATEQILSGSSCQYKHVVITPTICNAQ